MTEKLSSWNPHSVNDVETTVHHHYPESDFLHREKKEQEKFSKIREDIELHLRNKYANLEIPSIPWTDNLRMPIDKYYVELEMFPKDAEGREQTGVIIKLENILETINGTPPQRILIEGGPGFGKSTLALKITRDWESKSENYLSKYDLLYMIRLRDLNQSLRDALVEESRVDDQSDDVILKAIKTNQDKVLIILDGFDETPKNCKKDILPLVQQRLFPKATVIITSRPGNQAEEIRRHFRKRIVIKGFNREQQIDFLNKYISETEASQNVVAEKICQSFPSDLLRCPLMLMLSFVLYTEDGDTAPVETKTELYKSIFNLVARRGLLREKAFPTTEKLNLFSESKSNLPVPGLRQLIKHVHQQLNNLGEFALECLLEDRLHFTEKEIIKAGGDPIVLELGFLTNNLVVKNIREVKSFEPIHKSFLEFLVSMFVANILQNQTEDVINDVLRKVITIQSSFDVIILFIAGLLGSEADKLFNRMSVFSSPFLVEDLAEIATESGLNDGIVQAIKPLMDPFKQHLKIEVLCTENEDYIPFVVLDKSNVDLVTYTKLFNFCPLQNLQINVTGKHLDWWETNRSDKNAIRLNEFIDVQLVLDELILTGYVDLLLLSTELDLNIKSQWITFNNVTSQMSILEGNLIPLIDSVGAKSLQISNLPSLWKYIFLNIEDNTFKKLLRLNLITTISHDVLRGVASMIRLGNLKIISLTDESVYSFPSENEDIIDSAEGNYCSRMFNPLLEAMAENKGQITELILNMGSGCKQLPIDCSICQPDSISKMAVKRDTTNSYEIDFSLLAEANRRWDTLYFNGNFNFINSNTGTIEIAVSDVAVLSFRPGREGEPLLASPFQLKIRYQHMERLRFSANYLNMIEVDETDEGNMYETLEDLRIESSGAEKRYSVGNNADHLLAFISKFKKLSWLFYEVAPTEPKELQGRKFCLNLLKCASLSCVALGILFHQSLSFPSIMETVDDIVASAVKLAEEKAGLSEINSQSPVSPVNSSSRTQRLRLIRMDFKNLDFFRSRQNCVELAKHLVPLKKVLKTNFIEIMVIALNNITSPHLQGSTFVSCTPDQGRFPYFMCLEENEFFPKKEGFHIEYKRGNIDSLCITITTSSSS